MSMDNTYGEMFMMFKRAFTLLVVASLCTLTARVGSLTAAPVEPLELKQTIIMTEVQSQLDHMAFDAKRNRLYVAALGNGSVEVIDLTSGKVVHRLTSQSQAQAVLYLPEFDLLVVSSRGLGKCFFYSAESFELLRTVDGKLLADNLRYDPIEKRVYLGYGNGGIAVIDPQTAQVTADYPVAAHPEGFEIERSGNRIFVNLPTVNQLAVIDRKKGTVIETWKLEKPRTNFPMALDEANHRLFVGCHSPSTLLVIDTETGSYVAQPALISDCDDIFYDTANKLVFCSCGGGTVDLFQQLTPNEYKLLARTPTVEGGRTSLLVPEQNLYVVAASRRRDGDPQLMVFEGHSPTTTNAPSTKPTVTRLPVTRPPATKPAAATQPQGKSKP